MSQLFGMDFLSLNNRVNTVNKKTDRVDNKNVLGKPELSKSAASYYEELKAKFSDAEFLLVEDGQVENAQQHTANMDTDKKAIVIISESELEAMASDEATRSKNEKFISDAMGQMPQMMEELAESGVEVESYGMQFNEDGTVSYFAVLDKANAAQKERIENARAQKAEEAKNEKASNRPGQKKELTTVTASSMEELIKKIKDSLYEAKTDSVMTQHEKMIGQHFDAKF